MLTIGSGKAPAWYTLIRAARYLGVAPWELMNHSVAWEHWALIAEAAESEAQTNLLKAKVR